MKKEDFKVYRKVLDEITIFGLWKLSNKQCFDVLESVVKEGKESVVFSAKDKEGNWLAIKIYRIFHCDFKSMWKYLIADPRFLSTKKDRKSVIFNWCKREFRNMKIAYEKAKIFSSKPIAFFNNILIMEFIGENGKPAPRLSELNELDDPDKLYKTSIEQVKKLFENRLVHGDLSAFNILYHDKKPFFIDFSQGIRDNHPLFLDFLKRDLKNLNSFFKKFTDIIPLENLYEEIVGDKYV